MLIRSLKTLPSDLFQCDKLFDPFVLNIEESFPAQNKLTLELLFMFQGPCFFSLECRLFLHDMLRFFKLF